MSTKIQINSLEALVLILIAVMLSLACDVINDTATATPTPVSITVGNHTFIELYSEGYDIPDKSTSAVCEVIEGEITCLEVSND